MKFPWIGLITLVAALLIWPASAMPVAHLTTSDTSSDRVLVWHGHHYGWSHGRGHHYGWYHGRHRGW
jgi:hypothetical protein